MNTETLTYWINDIVRDELSISSDTGSVVSDTGDPCYNDNVCYQRFCCKIEFSFIKKLNRYPSKV